jgi:hypothetical protein
MNIYVSADRDHEPGKIIMRAQAQVDTAALAKFLPLDQVGMAKVYYDETGRLIVERVEVATCGPDAGDDVTAKVQALTDEEIDTKLAELNVKLAAKASRETKNKKLVEALSAPAK